MIMHRATRTCFCPTPGCSGILYIYDLASGLMKCKVCEHEEEV